MTAAVVTAGSQVYGGMAANAQGQYAAQIANQNAKLEERNRVDAISRGETEQLRHYRKLSQAIGQARVKNAAAGLDTGFGSAADMETDLALIGYEDSATISENTIKEVMGYDIAAINQRNEAKASKMRGSAAQTGAFIGAAGTILSSATQIGSMNSAKGNNWYGGAKG